MSRHAARWPPKYPGNLLPRGGLHAFVPPKQSDWPKNKYRGPRDAYIDRYGNVQHHDGRHTNVASDGSIHHGLDNVS